MRSVTPSASRTTAILLLAIGGHRFRLYRLPLTEVSSRAEHTEVSSRAEQTAAGSSSVPRGRILIRASQRWLVAITTEARVAAARSASGGDVW